MGDKHHIQVKPKEQEQAKMDHPKPDLAETKKQQKQQHHHHQHNKKTNHQPKTTRSSSSSSSSSGGRNIPTKEDLWKGAEVKTLPNNNGWIVEMTGLDSKSHTVYARAVQTADYKPSMHLSPSCATVVEAVVDVAWKHVARHILECKNKDKNTGVLGKAETLMVDLDHWDQGAFPPADQLLELGAVWLVNETSFLQQQEAASKKKHHHHHSHTKKKRLTTKKHGEQQPDWKDFVLRVHYAPNRFHAMDEVDWTKYCRGLLLGDGSVQVFLGDKMLAARDHIMPSGYPNQKDGVIVYEDADHGFAVLNKPGTVPDHATVNNHAEDVLTVFSHVLQDREKEAKKIPKDKGQNKEKDPLSIHHHSRAAHLSLPLPLDTETQGLVIIATKRAFGSYLTNMVEQATTNNHNNNKAVNNNGQHNVGVIKKYKCLVCIKKPEDMMVLNNLQESGAVAKHYYHHNPNHKDHTNFVAEIPERQHPHEYGSSQIRILKIGTSHGLYAANVTADSTVGDVQLAQRLWGLGVQNHSKTPAEDLGVAYVAQLEVEQVVDAEQLHTHLIKPSRLTPQQMICGQLAAMGFPLVGDSVRGGGTSEVWGHRHGWNRLALQCCEWSFPQPQWKTPLPPSETTGSDGDAPAAPPATEDTPKEQKMEATPKEEKVEETPKGDKIEETPREEKKEETQSTGEDSIGWQTVSSKKSHGHKDGHKDNNKPSQAPGRTSTHSKSHLVASREERCVFRLNEAWWNPLLDQYHVDGF